MLYIPHSEDKRVSHEDFSLTVEGDVSICVSVLAHFSQLGVHTFSVTLKWKIVQAIVSDTFLESNEIGKGCVLSVFLVWHRRKLFYPQVEDTFHEF